MSMLSSGRVWKQMIAVSIAITALLLVYKTLHYPRIGYQHLLVDYHFGFTKRALIGAINGLFFRKIPVWEVFVLGAAIWLVALALFVVAFKRYFGGDPQQLPLVVFTVCSPLLLKNFIQTIGYSDIYGFTLALIMLLIPARSFAYVMTAGVGCLILILIHHIHALMYVPTIVAIVVARFYLVRKWTPAYFAAGAIMLAAVGALFLITQFAGVGSVPQAEFQAYMESRMAGPDFPEIDANIWYQSVSAEITATWTIMRKNLLRVPIYALVIAAHAPLIGYFRRLVASLDNSRFQQLCWIAVVVITAAYLVMFVIIFDYSRWVANWFACMVLLMFAIAGLPRRVVAEPIPDTPRHRILGWIVAVLPRLGTTLPF